MPEEVIEELRVENGKLVEDGVRLFEKSRVGEAKLVAESVLEIDPADGGALALLADCHERMGQYHEALELCERIAVLKPDDSVAMIRVEHLRGLIEAEELAVAPANNRKVAMVAAVAASVLLFSVGAAFTISAINKSDDDAGGVVAAKTGEAIPFQSIAPVPTGGSMVPPSNGGNTGAGITNSEAVQNEVPAGVTNNNPPSTVSTPGRSGSGVRGGSSQPYNDPGNQPFIPAIPPGGVSLTPSGENNQRQPGPSNDPTGTFVPGEGTANTGQGEQPGSPATGPGDEPENDGGIIEIEVKDSKGTKPDEPATDGGSQAKLSVTALVSKARDLYLQGNYREAASTYEAALRAGASRGSTNQRIGQCYEKLGQRAKALAAYRKAASAYEAALKNGGGNSRIQTSLDACRQAIKALGG